MLTVHLVDVEAGRAKAPVMKKATKEEENFMLRVME